MTDDFKPQRVKIWCPHCGGDTFRAAQVLRLRHNQRIAIDIQCINCGTIISSDAVFEMATSSPRADPIDKI